MNPTRWAFLYTGIQRHERQQADLMQASIGRVLGAHLIPVRDAKTGKLRLPKSVAELQPVLPAIARPGFIAAIGEMFDAMNKSDAAEAVSEAPELDEAPPLDGEDTGFLPTDTGLEILERPTPSSDPFSPETAPKRSSFVLDE